MLKDKSNIKLFIGVIIGLLLASISVYAAGEILFQSNVVGYDNTTSGLTSTNVQDALDELLGKAEAAVSGGTLCTNTPFHIGDYVEMTPTSTSFTPDATLTGLVDYDSEGGNAAGTTTVSGTLNPSYLNLWRVIRINDDCTVEVVSEYVSDVDVKFGGKVGYANFVYYLNEIAKQYKNTTYTLDPATAPDGAFRNVGYDHQTKQITDMTKITSTTAPWDANTGPKTVESLGGGDYGFSTDLKLMEKANVPITAYKKGSTVNETHFNRMSYWLASRFYYYGSSWRFYARFVGTNGNILTSYLYYSSGGSFNPYADAYAVRPILTLKSGLQPTGSGTASNHYVLS